MTPQNFSLQTNQVLITLFILVVGITMLMFACAEGDFYQIDNPPRALGPDIQNTAMYYYHEPATTFNQERCKCEVRSIPETIDEEEKVKYSVYKYLIPSDGTNPNCATICADVNSKDRRMVWVYPTPVRDCITFKFLPTHHAQGYNLMVNLKRIRGDWTLVDQETGEITPINNWGYETDKERFEAWDKLGLQDILNNPAGNSTKEIHVQVCPEHLGGYPEDRWFFELMPRKEPYMWYISAESEYQYQSGGQHEIVFLNVPIPKLIGFEPRCSCNPCSEVSMWGFRPLYWEKDPTGQTQEFEFEAYAPEYRPESLTDHWYDDGGNPIWNEYKANVASFAHSGLYEEHAPQYSTCTTCMCTDTNITSIMKELVGEDMPCKIYSIWRAYKTAELACINYPDDHADKEKFCNYQQAFEQAMSTTCTACNEYYNDFIDEISPMVAYGRFGAGVDHYDLPWDEEEQVAPLYPGVYFWRMRAVNEWGMSEWSLPKKFAYFTRWDDIASGSGDASPAYLGGGMNGLMELTGIAAKVDDVDQKLFFANNGGGGSSSPMDQPIRDSMFQQISGFPDTMGNLMHTYNVRMGLINTKNPSYMTNAYGFNLNGSSLFGYHTYAKEIVKMLTDGSGILPEGTTLGQLNPYDEINFDQTLYDAYVSKLKNYGALGVTDWTLFESGLNYELDGDNIGGVCYDDALNVYFASPNTGYVYKYKYEYGAPNDEQWRFVTKYGWGVFGGEEYKVSTSELSSLTPLPPLDEDNDVQTSRFGDIVWHNGMIYATDANQYPEDDEVYTRYLWIMDTTMDDELESPRDAVVGRYPVGEFHGDAKNGESEMWGIGLDPCPNGECDGSGRLFIADNDKSYTDAIHVYDIDKNDPTDLTAKPNIENAKFHDLRDVAVDCDGNLYILDSAHGLPDGGITGFGVWIFQNDQGTYVPVTIGDSGPMLQVGNNKLINHRAIAVDSNRWIYVTALSGHVYVYLPTNF